MRIGIDARLWQESGVGRYIRNLVKWLERIDQENEYVLFSRKKKSVGSKWKKVLADIRWHSLKEQLIFPKILAKEKLDLVHFPYFSVPIFYNKPFVVTIHDLTITHFPTGKASTLPYLLYFLKHLGYQFILGQAIKRAKKIMVPSKATKNEILYHFKVPKEKIAVTYEGTNLCKINSRPYLKNIKFLPQTKRFFLYVGNAYPHKNLERLLRAFLKLKTKRSRLKIITKDLKLILVGKNDFFYKRLKMFVRKMRIKEDVVFYDWANDQELSWLYQNAVALVIPSLMEGFGLPALEAMACGCLVLASDIPALKEVCEKAAIYFNPYSIKDISQKMTEAIACLNKPKFRSRIKLGLKRAKFFSWKKMAEETLKIYQEVASKN